MNFDEWYEQEIGSENKPEYEAEYEAAKWAWDYQEKIIISLNAELRKNSKNKQKLLGENIELKRQLDCCREKNNGYFEKINKALSEMKNQLGGEDYDDLERPDYDAMLYALRNIKEILKGNQDDFFANAEQPPKHDIKW